MFNYFGAKKHLLSIISFVISAVLIFAPSASAVEVVISGNGEGSVNEMVVVQTNGVVIEQTNVANLQNEIVTEANTGENTISDSSGNAMIETGNVATQIVINNEFNESGVEVECCSSGANVIVADNGAGSQNSIKLEINNETVVAVRQVANIVNDVSGEANTGNNSISDSGGDVSIKTGNIYVTGGINNGPVNVANVNGSSGNSGVKINVLGNGVDSINKIFLSFKNNSDVQINSFTNIRNSVNWDLNTGGNEVSGANGSVEIITGDIFLDFFVNNGPVNFSEVNWDCCDNNDFPDDPEKPGDPEDPGENADDGTDIESTSGGGGSGSTSSSSSSESSSSAAVDGISILGLSDTSSPQAKSLIFFTGLMLMVCGIKLFGEEFLSIISSNNER